MFLLSLSFISISCQSPESRYRPWCWLSSAVFLSPSAYSPCLLWSRSVHFALFALFAWSGHVALFWFLFSCLALPCRVISICYFFWFNKSTCSTICIWVPPSVCRLLHLDILLKVTLYISRWVSGGLSGVFTDFTAEMKTTGWRSLSLANRDEKFLTGFMSFSWFDCFHSEVDCWCVYNTLCTILQATR